MLRSLTIHFYKLPSVSVDLWRIRNGTKSAKLFRLDNDSNEEGTSVVEIAVQVAIKSYAEMK